jgi:hypothetical protein
MGSTTYALLLLGDVLVEPLHPVQFGHVGFFVPLKAVQRIEESVPWVMRVPSAMLPAQPLE